MLEKRIYLILFGCQFKTVLFYIHMFLLHVENCLNRLWTIPKYFTSEYCNCVHFRSNKNYSFHFYWRIDIQINNLSSLHEYSNYYKIYRKFNI